jgi:hypothetical protein
MNGGSRGETGPSLRNELKLFVADGPGDALLTFIVEPLCRCCSSGCAAEAVVVRSIECFSYFRAFTPDFSSSCLLQISLFACSRAMASADS